MARTPKSNIKNGNVFLKNKFTRFFGGTGTTVDPLVKGFFVVAFEALPPMVEKERGQLLMAVSTGITLPAVSLDPITIEAIGGLKYHVPGALTIGDTLSITFEEFNESPVYKVIQDWVAAIRDNVGGFANSEALAKDYVGKNYGAQALAVYFRPNFTQIENAWIFEKIWPKKVPTDELNATIANPERTQYTIDFSVDMVRFSNEPKVLDKAKKLADLIKIDSTMEYLYKRAYIDEGGSNA